MALLRNSQTLTLNDGVLAFVGDGNFSFEYKRFVQVLLEGGQTTNLTQTQYQGITKLDVQSGAHVTMAATEIDGLGLASLQGSLNITGVSFVEDRANPAGGAGLDFEPSVNLNSVIESSLAFLDAGTLASRLTVDGSRAEGIMLVWDYLDDGYVQQPDYYNTPRNENFVRLGIEYADYLADGGAPLTDVTAKFTADGGDSGATPDRMQSLHDNLLGNLNLASLQDRFGADPAKLAQLLALVPDEYEARPTFSGDEGAYGGAAHDAVRAFDYEKGWDRDDWIDTAVNARVDARAQKADGSMLFGAGNSADNWAIVRHEGAGVELALKAKERGGPDYVASVDADGTARYVVATGPDEGTANRAAWNFEFAATSGISGQDETVDQFVFKLLIDVDATTGTRFIELDPAAIPTNPASIWSEQNSSNFGFSSILPLVDGNPQVAGVQPYGFGDAEFDIVLQAYDGGRLIATNQIVIQVGDGIL